MSSQAKTEKKQPPTKICPTCAAKNPKDAKVCGECDSEFPPKPQAFKKCEKCGALNLIGSEECQECGHSFRLEFQITLNEALRVGAIVRGMDLDEEEVREGERDKAEIVSSVLASGDDVLIKMIKQLPEESRWTLKKNSE